MIEGVQTRPRSNWEITFKNSLPRGFYFAFRALEPVFSILVLGFSADALKMLNAPFTPPVLVYFFFTSVWSVLALIYIAMWAKSQSISLVLILETINILNVFISAVTYASAWDLPNDLSVLQGVMAIVVALLVAICLPRRYLSPLSNRHYLPSCQL